MRYYDFKAINESVPIRDVMDSFGLETTPNRSGKIPCPSAMHKDKHPSAVINEGGKWHNTCHCFSCGETFNPIRIAMQEKDCSITDACAWLCDTFHLQCYEELGKETVVDEKEKFPLSINDLRLLGLKPNTATVEENGNRAKFSVASLWKEDKVAFCSLVSLKCKEKEEKIGYGNSVIHSEIRRLSDEITMLCDAVCIDKEKLVSDYEDGQVYPPKSIEFVILSDISLLSYYKEEKEKNDNAMSQLSEIKDVVSTIALSTKTEFVEEEDEEYEIV